MKNNDTAIAMHEGDTIENFLKITQNMRENILAAAQMLHRMVSRDPQVIEKIIERAPDLPRGYFTNMLRVGEGSLHPRLLLNNNAVYARLRGMPYTVQKSVIEQGAIDVAVNADSAASIRVPITDLKPQHIKQVFSGSGLRSVDEQRAMLKRRESLDAKPTSRADAYPWVVKKDKVTITRAVELTRKDIVRILEEMTG